MPFINARIGDAKESEPVPDGQYDLRIAKVDEKKSKKPPHYDMLLLTITIEDPNFPNASPVFHNMLFPKEDTEERTANLFQLGNARLLTAFGVPFDDNGFDSDDLLGATAKGITVQQEENPETGDPTNRLILPRLDSQKETKKRRRA